MHITYLLQLVETQTKRADTAIKANTLLAMGNSDLISNNHRLHAQIKTQTKGTEALKEWYQDLQDVAKNNSRQKERAIRELTTIDKTLELAGIKVPGINAK